LPLKSRLSKIKHLRGQNRRNRPLTVQVESRLCRRLGPWGCPGS